MSTLARSSAWSPFRRISFRYLFVLFSLIVLPFPFTVIPLVEKIAGLYEKLFPPLVNWVGRNLAGVTEPIAHETTGSGDTLYDWLWYACIILLTLILGTVFNVLDRNRQQYNRLQAWFLLILSYYLAHSLLSYGIIKLFNLQFPPPPLASLFETYGQSSPMRLMWTFMGASSTYTVFSGCAETLTGVLLLFRRTRLVGAIAAFGVMLNVFLLNMSYDIPVKLYSFQLMVIGLYLMGQHWRRLFAFFFTDGSVPAPVRAPLYKSQRGMWVLLTFQVLFAGFVIVGQIMGGYQGRQQYGLDREKSALYGVYNVTEFSHNGKVLPDLVSDTVRWRRVLFDYPHYTPVIMMNDQLRHLRTSIDTSTNTIFFTDSEEDLTNQRFAYERIGKNLRLEGIMGTDTLRMELEHYDLSRFGLLNRGFHWVNEVPYNRYNRD